MIEAAPDYAILLLFMGFVTLLIVPVKALLGLVGVPALVWYILLGAILSFAIAGTDVLTPGFEDGVEFLAKLGIVALLFRAGLESDLKQMVKQLRNAATVWVSDVSVSASLVFAVVYFWPGMGLIPALFAGIAASATSISVSIVVWEDSGAIDTREGAILLDVAELDDLSSMLLMSVLFAVAPMLKTIPSDGIVFVALQTAVVELAWFVIFCAACYGFSRYVEHRFRLLFNRLDKRVGTMLFAAGTMLLIAAGAELIGFSIAVGALFAGLAFSDDPQATRIDKAIEILVALFGPFFFLTIGLSLDLSQISEALGLTALMLAAAVSGKLLGAGLPSAALLSQSSGMLIGASMIPRAEIFLIVMLQGLSLGPWAVPPELYAAAVVTCLITCLLGPVAVARALPHVKLRKAKV
jgi:Kef-type K+ transport system membrane component KefB